MADRDIAKPAERPWSELTHPEKLDKETGVSLDITAKILNDGAESTLKDAPRKGGASLSDEQNCACRGWYGTSTKHRFGY
jgi:hypothetical protein